MSPKNLVAKINSKKNAIAKSLLIGTGTVVTIIVVTAVLAKLNEPYADVVVIEEIPADLPADTEI